MTSTDVSEYGPEKYVVEYKYDGVGRLVRKEVRDTPLINTGTSMQDSSDRFGTDYQYDGRGGLVRESLARHLLCRGF